VSGCSLAPRGGPRLLTDCGTGSFAGDQAIVHFEKHGSEVMSALGKNSCGLKDSIADANSVIRNGTWVPELSGYTQIIGGPGSAKAAFVGLNRATGDITTFHVKSVTEMAKKAPSIGWVK
jgi:filamentous hemagglutinin